jgi:ABC-2 type transport system ATP-binding protein
MEILGETVSRPNAAQKRQIGYVSQEQHFYPWMRCAALGRFVGAFYPSWDAAEFDRLLKVLDVPPDRKVVQLSGGMRAKLGLALALAHRPKLLLLDEPTAGLDPAARREFLEIVRLQANEGGRTTVFSSHIVEEVERVADRVGILDRGRLVFEGDLATLRASVRRLDLDPPPPPVAADEAVPAPYESLGVPAEQAAAPPAPTPPPAPASALPPSFEVLSSSHEGGRRSLVLRAAPEAWETTSLPPGRVVQIPVEDIFLALTVGRQFRA